MTYMLVSLERTKEFLRVGDDDDDMMLTALIGGASRAVLRYLKGQAATVLGVTSPPDSPPAEPDDDVPEDVQIATILLVGQLYRNPDNDQEAAFERGYLPKNVTAILYPLRDPALA